MARKPSPLTDLEKLAAEVAVVAPLKKTRAARVQVSWKLIERIREELDRRGFDWKDVHKQIVR